MNCVLLAEHVYKVGVAPACQAASQAPLCHDPAPGCIQAGLARAPATTARSRSRAPLLCPFIPFCRDVRISAAHPTQPHPPSNQIVDHTTDVSVSLINSVKAQFPPHLTTLRTVQWAQPHVRHRYLLGESDDAVYVSFMGECAVEVCSLGSVLCGHAGHAASRRGLHSERALWPCLPLPSTRTRRRCCSCLRVNGACRRAAPRCRHQAAQGYGHQCKPLPGWLPGAARFGQPGSRVAPRAAHLPVCPGQALPLAQGDPERHPCPAACALVLKLDSVTFSCLQLQTALTCAPPAPTTITTHTHCLTSLQEEVVLDAAMLSSGPSAEVGEGAGVAGGRTLAAHRGFLARAGSIPVQQLYQEARARGKRLVLCGEAKGRFSSVAYFVFRGASAWCCAVERAGRLGGCGQAVAQPAAAGRQTGRQAARRHVSSSRRLRAAACKQPAERPRTREHACRCLCRSCHANPSHLCMCARRAGHSLGGAVASLCAIRLLQHLPPNLHHTVRCARRLWCCLSFHQGHEAYMQPSWGWPCYNSGCKRRLPEHFLRP